MIIKRDKSKGTLISQGKYQLSKPTIPPNSIFKLETNSKTRYVHIVPRRSVIETRLSSPKQQNEKRKRKNTIMNPRVLENNPGMPTIRIIAMNRATSTVKSRRRGKGHSFSEDYFIPRLSRRTRIPRRSVSVQLKIPIGSKVLPANLFLALSPQP